MNAVLLKKNWMLVQLIMDINDSSIPVGPYPHTSQPCWPKPITPLAHLLDLKEA